MILRPPYQRVCNLLMTAAAFLFCLAIAAFAANDTPSLASGFMSALTPSVLELVATVLGVAGTWLITRLVRLIGISDSAKRLEVEAKLRDGLHFAADNGLRFALTKAGLPAIAAPAAAVVADAMFYVREKNPQTLEKLGVNDKALEDIILSKWPTASLALPIAAHWSSIPKT
ncbi:hypothetical protein [Agrobacterium vitis]|uniref:hypothetical protein n=1 Tax=Agrobacterium vitis TaxID=373 RepID=UPI0012E94819|nr:hypothetical protein [Agrobacterium vitis]MVA40661.1 hypothetical protein [Agrobacterium vitis]NSX96938.1 hypothetical protein [Agrobacterium vitis]NSZ28077.1 hypothetical protein [Agrobacterium vitis]UJL77991.1 hypothetical protein AVCG678_11120 [Agrobacterium vitis]UJL83201.1 hypothetical protein AVCG78_11120 [Agrobacterium vitis]